MSERPTWMNWATEAEISHLFELGLSVRSRQNALNAERKKVRDRCYQRALRHRLKESVKP